MASLLLLVPVCLMMGLSSGSPYNCSVMNGKNVTWMQMLDDKTVLGGYSYYFLNGTLHNYDLEDNLITIGQYTVYPDTDDAMLCYEKETYDRAQSIICNLK